MYEICITLTNLTYELHKVQIKPLGGGECQLVRNSRTPTYIVL